MASIEELKKRAYSMRSVSNASGEEEEEGFSSRIQKLKEKAASGAGAIKPVMSGDDVDEWFKSAYNIGQSVSNYFNDENWSKNPSYLPTTYVTAIDSYLAKEKDVEHYIRANKSMFADYEGTLNSLYSLTDSLRSLRTGVERSNTRVDLGGQFNGITENLNKYGTMIDSGEYLTKDQLDEYSKLAQDYVTVGSKLFTEENGYDQATINKFQRSHPSVASSAAKTSEFYSQFDSEESYGWWKDYQDRWGHYTSAEDFEEYAAKGAGVANPSWDDSRAPVDILGWTPFGDGKPVTNMVTFAEANKAAAETISAQAVRAGTGMDETTKLVIAINLYMTDTEKRIYNYLVGKGETEKANEFLEELKDTFAQREAGNYVEQVDGTWGEPLFSAVAGIDSFVSGVRNLDNYFRGDEADPTTAFQYARGEMAKNDEGVWKGVNDLTYTIGNMVPSIMVGSLTGGFGGAMTMGVSATGNAYADMRNAGYDEWQSRGYATLVGASETALSYFLGGISKLGGGSKGIFQTVAGKLVPKLDNAIARVAIQLGGNMLDEGLEEAIQAVLEPAFKAIMTGEDFEAPEWEDVFYSGLLGSLSAGLLEGVPSVIETSAQSLRTRGVYGTDAQALVTEALEIDPENAHAQRMQARLDSGKKLSGYQLNRLVEHNEASLKGQDISKIRSATRDRLEELGETGDVSAVAEALTKQAAGEKLSRSEQKLISESKYGQRVANELNPDNIQSDGYSTEWAEKLDTERINVEEYSRLVKDAELAGETAETTGDDVATDVPKAAMLARDGSTPVGVPEDASADTAAASDGQVAGKLTGKKSLHVDEKAVSADGQAEIGGNKVVLNGLRENADGTVVVATADDQTADPGDVKYPSMGHALVYENYANIEAVTDNPVLANMDVDTRSLLARAYNPAAGVKAEDYFFGSNLSFQYGFEGIPMNDKTVSENPILSNITGEQRDLAYDLGRKAGRQAADTQDAGIHKAYEKAVEKLGGKGAAKAVAKKNPGKVVLRNGIVEDTMTEKQKAAYKLARTVSKATGVTINIYRGMREHGKYNPATGEIWLNINSNISGSSMMAFTLAHELVHMAKQWKPADFKTFADYLFEQYGKKGVSVDALIREQMTKAKENGYTLNEHEAYEEVIADACQRMLLDSDALQKMAAYKEKNPGTWQKIVNKIREFIIGIRNLFKGAEPDSMEAALYKTLDEDAKQFLEKLFVDMVMGAGEHMSTIRNAFGKGTVVEVNADGEFTLAKGNVDGATKFLYNDSTWENGGRDTLKAALEAEGFSNEDIKAALTIMDGKHEMVKKLAEEFPEQDRINKATITTDLKDGHSVLSALVSNGDYPVNIDLLMVCKKRKAYQRVINRLCETGLIQQATVDALAIAEINKILGKYGFETACLGCFVESRRLRIQEWANTIVKEWNSEVKKRNPDAKTFGFGKGEAKLTPDEVMQLIGELETGGEKNDQGNLNLGQGSAVKRMGVLLDKVPSLRKTLSVEDLITPDGLTALRKFDSNLFSMVKSRYGSNSPKFVQEFNPYNHELAKYGKVPSEYKSLREYLYAIGGARMQSFSDFIVENWFDYCQIVADLAARKLPMHTYTKEISLAKLFGLTGIKINMSLIPDIDRSMGRDFAGLTRNENGELELIWADKDRFKKTGGKSYMQSINFADAIALQNDPRYSGNVGTIAVGVSKNHILMMLDDARIRMIIPYHSSGMNPIFADLMGTSYYTDYTNVQNTRVKQLYNSKGQKVSVKLDKTQTGKLTAGFQFNAVLQELGDARAAADAYKEWCADASKHTITIKGETYTAELTPKFDEFAWHDNYYKLLEDFNTYDCISEEAAPQGDVQQTYPDNFDEILKAELTAQEKYRQKQEENQAFDQAMGEIESFLSTHTKADTVFYAEQHGVKLSDKDKKLGAEDKKKLAGLRKGEKYSMPKVKAPTFYSQMEKVVDGMKQEKFGASSVVSMLRGRGVKAEEIKWSGIEEWLAGKKSVTKAELQEFIAGSMLQIEEETLSSKEIPFSQEELDLISKYEAERDAIAENLKSEWKRIVGTDIPIVYFGSGLESAVVQNILEANATKKGETEIGYQYKAAMAALKRCIEYSDDYFGYDNEKQAFMAAVRGPKDFMDSYELTSFEKGVFRDFIKAKEAYAKVEGIPVQDQQALKAIAESAERFNRRISNVKSEHYAKTAKQLSKWGQYKIKGGENYREILFKMPGSTYKNTAMYGHWDDRGGILAHARIQDFIVNGRKMLFVEEIQSDWHNEGHKDGYDIDAITIRKRIAELTKQWDELYEKMLAADAVAVHGINEKMDAIYEERNRLEQKVRFGDFTPDAPFRDNYHEYVLKRLLREAAENGYDSIGWTTADIQSDRWSDEYAEGYRIEYDQDIPKFLRKYGKKWGAEVGKTVLDNGTEVWSMAITDAMKDSVLYEGQPKYSMPKAEQVYTEYSKPISEDDIATLRTIGKISVNAFKSEDIQKTQKWAYKFYDAIQEKSPFFRSWFGEWRANSGNRVTAVKEKSAGKLGNGRAKNRDVGIEMSWNAHDIISETINHAARDRISVKAINQLAEIVENAILLDTVVSMPTSKSKMKNTAFMHSFYAVYNAGAETYIIKLYAEMALNNRGDTVFTRAYQLKDIKKVAVLDNGVLGGKPPLSDANTATINTVADLVDLVKRYDPDYSPKPASKVVNKDGTPRIVYHYTNGEFWSFDTERSGSNQGQTHGDGIYLSTSPDEFSYAGKNKMELYASIKNPFEMQLTDEQAEYVLEKYAATKHDLDKYHGLYRNHAMEKLTSPTRVFDYLAEYAADNGIKVSDILKDLGYDGVHDGSEWVAFDSTQVKSATDNIGTFDGGNTNIRYKTSNSHGMSPRQLLADAFDELVQTPDERELMDRYRKNITKVEEAQERLDELRGEISRLTKAKGDKGEIAELNREAGELVDQIDKYDRELLKLEASKPLKDVLARARSAAYQKAKQRSEKNLKEYRQQVSERFSRGVEGRRKTEMRKKIRKVIRDLDKILNRGDKKRNVKEDMKDFVAEALSAADVLFTDNYTNEDMVRNGFGVELSKEETRYMEEARGILDDMAKLPAGSYESWYERQEAEEKLKSRLAYRMGKLKDAFFRERQRLNKTEVAEVLSKLADSYAKLENSEYAYVNGAYHESVHAYLKMLQEDVGGAKVKDMTLGQLEELYKAYTMVLTTVQNANKMFSEDLKQSKEELANRVMMEVHKAGGEHGLWSKGELARNQASWNNTKPIYAAERTGSPTFVKLVNGLFKGQYNWAVDMDEAKAYRQKVADKYGFKSWDMEKTYKFTSSSGIDFELNLNQIMALYAYAKREQAHDHLLKGGFVFGKNTEVVVTKNGIKRTYLNKSAKAHNISDEIMGEIIGKLTDKQKGFVDEMQDYLSTTMGNKGNEVSMRLYGVKLFMEKFYFPLRSAGQFKEKAKEAEMKQQQGQISIANSGFTHSTTPKASNPVVLDGFTDVWASHVNEMSLYHSMVLPMEDFRRVYNYASPNMEGQESASVNSFIENAYGDAATGYFDQLYKELNGGAIVDPRENIAKQRIGKFKKAAVMLSNSVWVQQFSAIGRAYALIDPKYFIGPKVDKKRHAALWEEVKQYAPVAIIKEMGGFDTHTGLSAKDYLLAEEYGKGERLKALVKDKQYRDEVMGLLPAKADELTWCSIWEAVKRETQAKNPKMDVKSEEFLKKAGERFSEVIEKTQVYDSVLARSANMRSKNALMQMLTAFMAEPTTTVNMIENALRKGNKKVIARTFGAVAATIVLNNALVSIIYAMRDDDEDETFLEKYSQAFTSGMLDDINPMTYYPVLKDIWSLFQGYDIERSDMAIYSDISDAVKKTVTQIAKYDSEMDEDEAAEYYKEIGSALMSILDAGAAAFGVPLKNVRRDLKSYYNTYETFTSGNSTTWNSFVDAVGGSAKDSTPIVGLLPGETKTDKLYDAIIDGDKEYVDRLKGGYKDTNAYNNAVKKALLDHDSRIKEAAQAQVDGDPSERIRIARLIIADGFPQDAVVMAINAEINALTPDDDSAPAKKVKGDYTAADFAREFANGDHASVKAAREDIIETAQKNGKSQKEAEEDFASDARSEFRDLFVAGELSESDANKALKSYCPAKDGPLDDNDIYWIIREWEYEKANGSSDGYRKYNDFHGAVETGRDLGAVISEYTSHGVKKETLASEITSHFKPLYREMSSSKRATFKKYLLNAYAQLGYDRSKKSKDIDKWLED